MSHYERRLAADKGALRERVSAVGERVEQAVADAVKSLLAGDCQRCAEVVLGDMPINREVRAIDSSCHAFVARHLPSAGHLRFVSSVMRMTVALERVGDYAVTIARQGVQLTQPPPDALAERIVELSKQSCGMLGKAMTAFADRDAELARETKPLASEVGRTRSVVYREVAREDYGRPLADRIGMLSVFNRLERVSDQAKNICEETLFVLTGETKPPKVYRVMFVDHTNTILGPLATAIARKAFPESGHFTTAGHTPGSALAPELEELAEQLGLDLADLEPTALPTTEDELAGNHVIVLLTSSARSHLQVIPFHTSCLQWDLPPIAGDNGDPQPQNLKAVSRELSSQIRELMVTLRGEDAL